MERSGTREGTASDDGTALRARPEAEIAGLKAILAQRDRVPAERDRLVSELQGSRERNAARGHAMTASLPAYALIPLPGEGPEDVVVGPDGVIYTGLLDGRVLAVAPEDGAVREVANIELCRTLD